MMVLEKMVDFRCFSGVFDSHTPRQHSLGKRQFRVKISNAIVWGGWPDLQRVKHSNGREQIEVCFIGFYTA